MQRRSGLMRSSLRAFNDAAAALHGRPALSRLLVPLTLRVDLNRVRGSGSKRHIEHTNPKQDSFTIRDE